jgi:hypothetical protein
MITENSSAVSLSQLLAAMIPDAKSAVSLVVALGGACATLAGNWQAITEGHTLRTKIKSKSERVKELVALLNEVKDTPEFKECRDRLHAELKATLAELDDLRERASSERNPQKNELTVPQRLFIFFPPRGPHAWIIHLFAYAFMFGGPLAILLAGLFCGKGEDRSSAVSDLVILTVFGAMAFRSWALSQRRWEMAAPGDPVDCMQPGDSGCDLFVMRRPANRYMLAAQIALWVSIFCILESMEDLIFEGLEQHKWTDKASAALCLFMVALAVSLLCRAWADAEWRYASSANRRAHLPDLRKRLLVLYTALAGVFLAGALTLLLWQWHVVVSTWKADLSSRGDNFDRAEVCFLLLATGMAIIHWVSVRRVAREPVPVHELRTSPEQAA